MAGATYALGSFLGGEWSQSVQGRFDRPDYRTAMTVCFNGFPLEEGAWTRRPGTQFLGTTRSGLAGRVYPFDFRQQVPYSVEFTNGHIRFWAGNQLVTASATSGVSNISTAKPAVVTTGADIGLTGSADQVVFTINPAGSPAAAPPLLLNRTFSATKIDATHFSIADAITGLAIDGSTLNPFNAFSVIADRVVDLTTPYISGTSSDWANVQIVQAETQGILLNGSTPQLLNATVQPTATSFATFTLSALDALFIDGPYLDPNNSTLTTSNNGATLSLNGAFPDPRSPSGFVAADVGRHIRIYSQPPNWAASPQTYNAGDLVTGQDGNSFWVAAVAIPAGGAYPKPGTNSAAWGPVAPAQAASWVWGRITAVHSATSVDWAAVGGAFINQSTNTIILRWQLGLYGNAQGWPTCGVYHEGRLWLSGVIDNRIDSSMSNNLLTFSPSGFDGTVAPNNAISATFNASDVNAIFWMNSEERGIVCGTQGGEWLVSSGAANTPLTPSNIQAHRPTKIGCANVEPRRAGNTLVFVQRHQRKLQEYFPDVYSGRLTSPNMTGTAKHLTGAGIQEVAGYQQELAPLLWVRMGDGSLKAVTYKRENLNSSQGPNFAGWHRHALGSGRTVTSICMGSATGNLDNLMMVTTDGAISHVEMMTDIFEETDALANAWFLDDAVVAVATTVTSTPTNPAPYGGVTFTGLWHLNGKTVQAFAGGLDCGDRGPGTTGFTDFVVTLGSIFVPFGDGISAGPGRGLFTQAFLATGIRVIAGFTYNSDGQPVRPITQADSGARNGPAFAKLSRGHRYGVKLVNALGISFGGDLTKKMYPAILTKADGKTAIDPLTMFNGIHQDSLNDDYGYEGGTPAWRISRPWPATIAAVGTNLSTQDQ